MSDLSQSFLSADSVLAERRRYFAASRGGISLPVAGAIYWIVLGVLGYSMELRDWALTAAFTSGAIFPLGLLLQGPLKSPFMKVKSPLGGVTMAAIISINMLWPLHFIIFAIDPSVLVYSLAIAMTLHWPVIGWAYASKVSYAHAAARLIAATGMFILLPDDRMTLLPFAIAALYLLAALGMAAEAAWARRRIAA